MNAVPFTVNVPDTVLADLRDRLARTRWPDEIPGAGWDYGVSPAYLKDLTEYWRTGFDWRVHESRLNALPNVTVEIDGLRMHAIHQRGRGPRPLPLLITHGWPSTCYEAIDLIPLLTNPDDP
ncbi:MAG TPA: epoxide hydrolase N-terminal domain-containing protein, partial [Trebonia sp.]